LKVGMWNFVRK